MRGKFSSPAMSTQPSSYCELQCELIIILMRLGSIHTACVVTGYPIQSSFSLFRTPLILDEVSQQMSFLIERHLGWTMRNSSACFCVYVADAIWCNNCDFSSDLSWCFCAVGMLSHSQSYMWLLTCSVVNSAAGYKQQSSCFNYCLQSMNQQVVSPVPSGPWFSVR